MATAVKADWVEDYRREGYAIVRGLFSPAELVEIGAAVDAVHAAGVAHGRSFREGNIFYNIAPGEDGAEPQVRMAQWIAWESPVLAAVRADPRIAALLAPLIGGDVKQIINQLHWKVPGSLGDFAWHQDSRFRLPEEAYRNLGGSYIQTGLAIDPHNRGTGGMRFLPRSHDRGTLPLDTSTEVLGSAMADGALVEAGLDPAETIHLDLQPGDFAMWNPYLVHGSGRNDADHLRRLYINGYVRAEDCDRGEWAFRDGRPVPLEGDHALVHYEALEGDRAPRYV